jgi:4,5-dihydroxyphthalate decarboxylase
VIPDAQNAGPAAYARSGLLPLNHMLTVSRTLAQSHPESLREIMRLMRLSKAAGGLATGIDFQPLDHEAIVPSLDLAIDLAFEQGLVSQCFCAEDVLAASRACLHA